MNSEPEQQVEHRATSYNSEEVVGVLHSVVCDVETFMSDWLRRAQCELAVTDPIAGNETLRRRFQGFQAEKRQWEAKRQCELEAIEHKANQLTEAWLKLEAEQRESLKPQDRKHRSRRSETVEPTQVIVHDLSPQSAEPPSQPTRRTTNSIEAAKQKHSGSIDSMNDSVRQFQQLRREIEMTRAAT
ncbi:MAG: hypothetical protein ACPGLY_20930 [Rubripirellula sp.]